MFYRNFSKRYLNFQIIFIYIAVDRVLIGVADNFFSSWVLFIIAAIIICAQFKKSL